MAHWHQYQANAASQGFAPLSTIPANSSKWQIEVGRVAFASPVIGLDGTIYIGNLQGELLAINPNGSLKWRRQLDMRGSFISGSAAIDANGNIYFITTFRAKVRDHRNGQTIRSKVAHSKLHSLNPDGSLRWTFSFPVSNTANSTDGYTLSSPKIVGKQNQVIFVPAIFTRIASRLDLMAIDLSGNLINRITVSEYPTPPVVVTGGGVGDIFAGIWDFLNGAEFNPSGGGPTLKQLFGQTEPTLAVADFGPFKNQPVIVIDDNYKQLSAFRWESGRIFTPLWKKTSSQVRPAASPAILSSSMVAAGQADGTLALYDVLTGNELWKPWYKAKNAIQSPPASFISQIYLTSHTSVIALDANGRFLKEFKMSEHSMGAALGSPAISANHVYVNAQEGLFSFSLDLNQVTQNSMSLGGVSSPAIAGDGTIYSVDRDKRLWALI
jgi:outer membrane protein assembly factor BamB